MTLKNFDNFFLNEDEDSRASYDRWWEETQPQTSLSDEIMSTGNDEENTDESEEELRNNLIRDAGKYVEKYGKDKLKEVLDELYPY